MQGLVTLGTTKLLNGGLVPPPEVLQAKISGAIGSEGQSVFVFKFGLGQNPSYLVAYNISVCAVCGRSWIGAFAYDAGHYSLRTSFENPVTNQSLTVVPLWTSNTGMGLLVYGTQWGDAHNRLNAVAYVFDGQAIRPFWSRSDLPEGTLAIRQGSITLSFLTALRPPWKRRTEVYSVAQNSIELRTASEAIEE